MLTPSAQSAAGCAVRSLFRKLVREAKRLPDDVAQQHFLNNIRADFRSLTCSWDKQQRTLRWLQAANAGYLHALMRCLEVAHARRGKLKRKRIEELLSITRNPDAKALQAGNTRTKPPVYNAQVQAYLTSPHSFFKGKAPTSEQLATPPSLPARANPASEEARLLGRLSPRREANIRWRQLTSLRDRLLAPMSESEGAHISDLCKSAKARPRFKKPASSAEVGHHQGENQPRQGKPWRRPKHVTSRFLRRRYEELLSKGIRLESKIGEQGQTFWTVKPANAQHSRSRRFEARGEDQLWQPPAHIGPSRAREKRRERQAA